MATGAEGPVSAELESPSTWGGAEIQRDAGDAKGTGSPHLSSQSGGEHSSMGCPGV